MAITSPVRAIPEELERSLLYVELRPPDLVEMTAFLRAESGSTDDGTGPSAGAARCWG